MARASDRVEPGAPEQPPGQSGAQDFDVVLLHSPTEDGEGARVLRARPGRMEAGEVRPMRDGKPLAPGAELVTLQQRTDAPALYDVKVEHAVAPAPDQKKGPAQVATRSYRDNWDRTFGSN